MPDNKTETQTRLLKELDDKITECRDNHIAILMAVECVSTDGNTVLVYNNCQMVTTLVGLASFIANGVKNKEIVPNNKEGI